MRNKGMTHKRACHLASRLLFALSLVLITIPSSSLAVEYYPDRHDDIALNTLDPGAAYVQSGYARIQSSVDASPSVIYHWDSLPVENYCLSAMSVKMIPNEFKDDELEMEYSIDNGATWQYLLDNTTYLDGDSTALVPEEEPKVISGLQVRVNTEKIKRSDDAYLDLYYIKAQLDACPEPPPPLEPTITQSLFGVYGDVDASDFYAVTPSISGDARARAIATDASHMYVAGQVPLGTVRGWRIEKRKLADGLLEVCESKDCVAEVANGGEPHAMVLDDTKEFIYVVGDAYIGGKYCWQIEKRRASNLEMEFSIQVDPGEFTGKAHAAVMADDPADGIYDPFLFIAGSDYSQGDAQWRIIKVDPDTGSFEEQVANNPGNGDDIPYAMVTDGSSLYIGGYETEVIGKNKRATTTVQFRIEKRPIGDLSSFSFANSDHASETVDRVTALALHNGYLYAAGVWELGFWDTVGVIEKFDTLTLAEDPLFTFEKDYGYDDRPLALAVGQDCWGDGDDCLIAAGFSSDFGSGGDTAWRVDVLDLGTDLLAYSVLLDINSHGNDRVYALAVDNKPFDPTLPGPYMYLAGYQNPGLPQWHIQKRRISDGSVTPQLTQINGMLPNAFRSKIMLDIDTASLTPNAAIFELQYGECENALGCNSCEEYTYAPVSNFLEDPISFNLKGWDGMQALLGVPEADLSFFAGYDIRYQTIVEQQVFTSFTQIDPGKTGLWDFSLQANKAGTYCLRVVDSDDLPLDDYSENRITIDAP